MVRVLIIEDEIIIARFIEQQLLSAFPCTTRIAVSGAEARQAMTEMLPHLLLCDINLNEEQTGVDLINELRGQFLFEVIYITSYQARNIIEVASGTNPANYIIKPVDEAQLFAGVHLVMNKISQQPDNTGIIVQTSGSLNQTEQRIIDLIRLKKTTREIADSLFLSHYTIKNHRHNICRKLNLEDGNNALLKWVLQSNK